MAVTSPSIKLREGINALLVAANITYTKSSGPGVVQHLEKHPDLPGNWPYTRYSNAIITKDNAKSCVGWNAIVSIETVTVNMPGKLDYAWADEIEQQVIDAIVDEPYVLDVTPEYTIMGGGISLVQSEYFEEFLQLNISKKDQSEKYVVRKLSQFEILLNQA